MSAARAAARSSALDCYLAGGGVAAVVVNTVVIDRVWFILVDVMEKADS